MGTEIEIVYYERLGGVLQKDVQVIVSVRDASSTLADLFEEAFPEIFEKADISGTVFKCFAGSIEGQQIGLETRPDEVEFINDCWKCHMCPQIVLLSCKEPCNGKEDVLSHLPISKTASGMVQALMDVEPSEAPQANGFMPPGLLLPSLAVDDDILAGDVVVDSFQLSSSLPPPYLRKKGPALSIRKELYSIQDELIPLDFLSCSSSPSKLSDDSSLPVNLKKSDVAMQNGCKVEPKFFTLQRSVKSASCLPTKSFSASRLSRGDPAKRKLQRATAFRRKKCSSVFSPPTIVEGSFSFQVTEVHVIVEDGVSIYLPCSEHITVAELKDAVMERLNKQFPDRAVPWKPSNFALTYEVDRREYELLNEGQFLYKTLLYDTWARLQADIPIRVRPVQNEEESSGAVLQRISTLTGVAMDLSCSGALNTIAMADQKEAYCARRTLHSFVEQVSKSRSPEDYALSMEIDSMDTSTTLALKIPIDNKIEIIFRYKQIFSLKKRISVNCLADTVLEEVFPCVIACGLVEGRVESFTLQFSGEQSYISGQNELISFRDIRRCITKGEPVNLSVTRKPCHLEDQSCKLDWLPVDPYTAVPPLHTDITTSSHHDYTVQALSVWDREDTFTLRILHSENLPLTQSKSQRPGAVVEATLYHGIRPLCATVKTAVQPLDHTLHWEETLSFAIAQKNIPKAAKVMVVIKEANQRRESASSRKNSRFIYWGLTTVFDYQGMMYNGEKTLSLWRGKKDPNEDHYKLNPCGPASNNPDAKAVSVTVQFDTYSLPVYYPSSAPQSWSLLFSQESTCMPLRRQFKRLLEVIRDGSLHSAVPSYIEKVDWGSLYESVEVYSLLDQIADSKQSFPMEIALKLLDCDFPDEKVREFATHVLEILPDEQLEDFLLQLTQAMKFELNHDSALARFLLKRALRNKRIGHFFFCNFTVVIQVEPGRWLSVYYRKTGSRQLSTGERQDKVYLKCEMHNPQYRTRFGVILEAYLKGCGESMLKRFEDQVKLQTCLEDIGQVLKQSCGDDQSKMQMMLPEMLETRGIPDYTTVPVHNPRLTLGKLRPTKCKIMASKKKPQWLEMYNVDSTALQQTPIRLILKFGDDLRQDVITLRMFSIFEKLWECEGLDLSLIPYGCMATGPKTGFIEVVKNAKTIAEVSGVSNNSKLLEWIKSHQQNEFGEIEMDKVKAAVRTFIHSCAGYSVATYVLGIGDRHNDNIMITTSGNLFHIDFGHFLGNIKYCMGFKREWAPFVLTPDFVYTMGGEDSDTFEKYKNLCCRAFLTLRRHSNLIVNLFSMMRSTGIPELTCVEDTDYIRNALVLTKSELEAEQRFRKIIKKCLDLKWTVQIMWKIHLLRRGRGSGSS